jgi:hypothetical protein
MSESERAKLVIAGPEPARIDVGLLRPKDVDLVLTEWEDGEKTEVIYTIRGNLPTETMIEVFELEERIKAIPEDSEDRRPLIEVCDEVNAIVLELVQERYPHVEKLGFGVEEALGVLAFLAQNQSVAHEVAAALTGSGTRPNRETRRHPPRRATSPRTRKKT